MRTPLLAFALLGCTTVAPPRRHLVAPAPPELSPLEARPYTPTGTATPPAGTLSSRDGRTRTHPGPCQTDAAHPGSSLVACTTGPDGVAHEWTARAGGTLLDVFDGVALIGRAGEVIRYEIDAARETPMALPEPTARWVRAGFTADGSLFGLARTGTNDHPRAAWVHGPGSGPLAMDALPLDADDLDISDDRAVCVGPEGAMVASLLGWHRRITLPAPLPPTADRHAEIRRAGERVRCDADRCVIDGAVFVQLSHTGDTNDPTAANFR